VGYDAIVVPGAGVRPDGTVPAWVTRRLDRVLKIQRNEPILLLSGGTVHKPPPLDRNGFPIFESHAGARYLMDHGIPAGRILTEIMSWDTIGNAYFSKLIHIDPIEARRLLLVNSDFHSERCEAVFRWIYSLDPERNYDWTFESVPDEDLMPAAVRHARVEKERQGLASLASLTPRIRSLTDLRRWLFSKHRAYAGAPDFGPACDGAVLDSY